jgi:hypothetical protein
VNRKAFTDAELWQLTVLLDELVRFRVQEAASQGVIVVGAGAAPAPPFRHLSDEDIGWLMDQARTA